MYVGITDYDWFEFLKSNNAKEVNFWKPGSQPFKALEENDLFLFKLHSPRDYIVGGGFFVRFSLLPTYLAWNAFGEKNGTKTLDELNEKIYRYRIRNNMSVINPQIGCVILTDVFYFDEQDWLPAPVSFSKSIVQGKRYFIDDIEGKRLFEQIQERLQHKQFELKEDENRYSETLTLHRLGQGAFRIVVTEAYQRRCAITGEKTLPVLEAAHIKPYSQEGPHSIKNGLLLKSDFHTLFDDGYITIDTDYTVNVSKRLHDDYGNGKDYYKYHGEKMLILPENELQLPSGDFLQWHNENVYLG